MWKLIFALQILFVVPVSFGLAQETSDEYSDYSYLWDEEKKTRKKKKRKEKASPAPTTGDNLSQMSDTVPTDPLSYEATQVYDYDQDLSESDDTKENQENAFIDDFRVPMASQKAGGNFTGGFTYTTIGGEAFVGMVLSPEFAIGKVGVGLNIPLLYGLDSKSVRTEVFKGGIGPARLVRYIRYGNQKRDQVYVKAGQLDGIMIGFGGLVNNYSNTTTFEKRKVGLHFDVHYKGYVGLEGMYSDFDPISQNLLAIRPYVRPMSSTDIPVINTLEFGATIVSDKDQTNRPTSDSTKTKYKYTSQGVDAFGFDAGMTVFKIPFIQIDLFASYSNLSIKNDSLQRRATVLKKDDFSTGSGFGFGANFRLNFIANILSTDVRIERLSYTDYFLPQFFDAVYEINKDEKISTLITSERKNGIYGSLTGHILKKIQLGGSIMIPDNVSATAPAVVRVHADLIRLADKFSFHGSYIKGNLAKLSDAFKLDERSLAKLRFVYHMNKFLAAGVDYYYAFAQVEGGSYKATKTVIPYFGVSIDF